MDTLWIIIKHQILITTNKNSWKFCLILLPSLVGSVYWFGYVKCVIIVGQPKDDWLKIKKWPIESISCRSVALPENSNENAEDIYGMSTRIFCNATGLQQEVFL